MTDSKSRARAWREANPEKVRAYAAAYYAANGEQERGRSAAYRTANREKARARSAAWREANPERERARKAAYRAANQEKERARNVAYRAANPEKLRAQKAAYYKANIEQHRGRHAKYAHGLSPGGWAEMWQAQDGRCYLCGESMDKDAGRKVCVEHDHSCCDKNRSCEVCRRGLACASCNLAVGFAGDDPVRLRRMADALEAAQVLVEQRKAAAGEPVTLF